MIGQCVYIIKFSNGAWKIGYTGSIYTRMKTIKTDIRSIFKRDIKDVNFSLAYVFRLNNAKEMESILLNETRNCKRFHGNEYFYASDEEIEALIVKHDLKGADVNTIHDDTHRMSALISDVSWAIIRDYQEEHKIKTRDEALDTLLLHFEGMRKERIQ